MSRSGRRGGPAWSMADAARGLDRLKFASTIAGNLPEYVLSFQVVRLRYPKASPRSAGRVFMVVANEDFPQGIGITLSDFARGLAHVIGVLKRRRVGPRVWNDAAMWDAPMVDAAVQYAALGEVIYG